MGLRDETIKLATTLPKGSEARRQILAALKEGPREKVAKPNPENEAVISDSRRGYSVAIEGKHIDDFTDWDDAFEAVQRWMKKNNYYPDIYYVNERGNMSLLDDRGNEVRSWV